MSVRSVKPIRTAKTGYIVVSSVFCILGLLFIFCPEVSLTFMGAVCGAVLILFGAVRIVGYFSRDLYRLAFQYDLAFGILLFVLGTVLIVKPGDAVAVICIAIGVYSLADALLKIQIAIDSKRFGIRSWWLIFAVAVLAGAVGFFLVFRPSDSALVLAVLLGISFLAEGILNLITVLAAVKIINHQKPDVIEAGYAESINK